jgi:hypothetical protein
LDNCTSNTETLGTNNTQLATTAFVQAAIEAQHPVGSLYFNATNATNPGTLLGFGTWTAFGAGRVPVGFDAGNVLFDTAEETGGSADATLPTHTHAITDPTHFHAQGGTALNIASGNYVQGGPATQVPYNTTNTAAASTGITVNNAGTSGTNANYQPYITVYMWKRTA